MALEDIFGYDAPEDRFIGGEWYTWQSDPLGGGRMVAYSSLSPAEQARLNIGREYGQNVYLESEKGELSDAERRQVWQSYPQEMRDAINAAAGRESAPPPAPAPLPMPDPVQPPAPQPPAPPTGGGLGNWIGGLEDLDQIQDPSKRQRVEDRIADYQNSVNTSDFFDWQRAQADVLRQAGATEPQGGNYGLITGGPTDRPSFGGGAIWNTLQAAPTGPRPTMPMTTTPYQGGGIDPGFGNNGFTLPPADYSGPSAPPSPAAGGLPGAGTYAGGVTDLNQIQDAAKRQQMADAIAARLRAGNANPLAPTGGAGDATQMQ